MEPLEVMIVAMGNSTSSYTSILQLFSNEEISNSEDPGEMPRNAGLPWSAGKKVWKMKRIPGQAKVREFHSQSEI